MKEKSTQNKICFISGATGGLGKELSLIFAKNQCDLFLTSTNHKQLKLLANFILSKYPNTKIKFQEGDISDLKDIENIIKSVNKSFTQIDILINNAGVFPVKSLSKTSFNDFENCFNVNVRAPFIFTKEFSKKMMKNKWGKIINIASSSAYAGFAKTSIYCSSKHALLGFSRAIYAELKSYGIETYCVSPGSIKTKMGKKVINKNFESFMNPTDVATLIQYIIKNTNSISVPEIQLKNIEQ